MASDGKSSHGLWPGELNTKDRVTRIPLKTGFELMCSGRVCSFCSTSGISSAPLVTNPVISHE